MRPGYKQTEVGVIPEDWDAKPLDTFVSVTSGKRLPLGRSLTDHETSHPYIRVTDMRPGTVSLADIKYVPVDVFPAIKRYRIFKEDIFISVAGTLGIIGKIPPELDGANLTENADRITNITCSQDYLLHVLMSPLIQNTIESLQTVGAQPKLALTRIRKFDIPLPPTKAEQEAIAEALSDANGLIESLEQLLVKKRQLKQGAMQQLLTGKKRLPGFSGGWEVKFFGDLFRFSGGFSASRDQLSGEGYCYLHYGDIHTSHKTFIDVRSEYPDIPKLDIPLKKVSATSLLEDGDIVFVDASEDDEGTSKHVVVVNPDKTPFISGLHTIVAKSRTDDLDFLYRRYCFQTPAVKAQFRFFAVGTKVSGISKTNIAKIMLPVPTLPEQIAIATILSDMDAEIADLEAKLAKARAIKQGMMQELLTGRIRLVQPAASIVSLPRQEKTSPAASKSHNWQINEAVIIAVLARHFGSEQWPLGRKRYTKLAYLLHRRVEREAEGYLKKAAGPYNPATKYGGPEKIALGNGYIRQHVRDQYSGFVAAENIGQAESYFRDWYGEEHLAWLKRFRKEKNDELELLATVDMAMEDLRRTCKAVTMDGVKQVIQTHPEWQAKLDRPIFSDANITRAIAECRALFWG